MRFRLPLGACLGALLLLALVPERARAHGVLKRSRPAAGDTLRAAPRELRLEFNEAPELAVSAVRLIDASGREVALSALRTADDSLTILVAGIRGALGPGRHTVRWQIAGRDGHPVRGEFHFVIAGDAAGLPPASATDSGPPTRVTEPAPAEMIHVASFDAESVAYVAVRWAQFVGLVVVIGAVAFQFLVLGRVRRVHPGSPLAAEASARAIRLAGAGGVLLAVSSGARLVAQWAAMCGATDGPIMASLSRMVLDTTWGRAWMLQVAGLTLLAAALLVARRARRDLAWAFAAVSAQERSECRDLVSRASSGALALVRWRAAPHRRSGCAGGRNEGEGAIMIRSPVASQLPSNHRGHRGHGGLPIERSSLRPPCPLWSMLSLFVTCQG